MDKDKKTKVEECDCEDCKCENGKCSCENCECEECKCTCEDCKCEDCKCEKCGSTCEDCKCKDCECTCDKTEECQECEELKKKLEIEKNKNLATLADFVNYRKRSDKEKSELSIVANQILLQQIIEIIDDFDRALNEEKITKEGIELIYKKFTNVLDQYSLEEVKVKKGDKFNPETMEAVTAIHTQNEKEKGTVMDIISKGYLNKNNGQVYKTVKVITGK